MANHLGTASGRISAAFRNDFAVLCVVQPEHHRAESQGYRVA
jgi:hypothetical protein